MFPQIQRQRGVGSDESKLNKRCIVVKNEQEEYNVHIFVKKKASFKKKKIHIYIYLMELICALQERASL